jgi:hypothetical protein
VTQHRVNLVEGIGAVSGQRVREAAETLLMISKDRAIPAQAGEREALDGYFNNRAVNARLSTPKEKTMMGYYKVPLRDVYCSTLRQWLAECILCHVVYRLDPPPTPAGGPSK